MDKDSKFTRDEEGYVAVRVLSGAAPSANDDKESMFTRDEEGYVAVRVVNGAGGGGGDKHNLGWFSTLSELQTAYPTAEAGDWAIVGATDTVWIWDTDNSEWVDSDQKGQVTSVNNQTGAVTLGINDVAPTQTDKSGYVLGTDGFVAGWVKPEIVQCSTMPQASEEEVGKIYQYVGTTDANYTNGYFYKCVSDGQNPATFSWVQTNVQPAPSGLPDQTGQSGKFLTTDGTDASWSDKPLVNNQTQYPANECLSILGSSIGNPSSYYSICIGKYSSASSSGAIGIGYNARAGGTYSIAIGYESEARVLMYEGIAIGYKAKTTEAYAIQLGCNATNSDANTFKVANANGNFEIMSADGTIPTDRFTTTPSADGTYVPTVTISSGTATRSWTTPASAPVVPATMPTLAVNDWSSNTQTVNVTGVTASNVVFVSPAPASASDYASAGIVCTAQGAGTLTFTCTTTPTNAITVNVVILG